MRNVATFIKNIIKSRTSATVVLLSCFSMCLALLALVPGPWFGKQVTAELTVIVGGLTTMVSIVYVRNKKSEDSCVSAKPEVTTNSDSN